MQGTMPGARKRGRQRTAWIDNINTWTRLSVEESIRMTEDRDKWRKYVHGVANVGPTLGSRTAKEQNRTTEPPLPRLTGEASHKVRGTTQNGPLTNKLLPMPLHNIARDYIVNGVNTGRLDRLCSRMSKASTVNTGSQHSK